MLDANEAVRTGGVPGIGAAPAPLLAGVPNG
jgi:hypothetical protein